MMKKINAENIFHFECKKSIFLKIKQILKSSGYLGFPTKKFGWKSEFEVYKRERIEITESGKQYLPEEVIQFHVYKSSYQINYLFLNAKNHYESDVFPENLTLKFHKLEDSIKQRNKRIEFYATSYEKKILEYMKKKLGKSKSRIIREALREKLCSENLDSDYLNDEYTKMKHGYIAELEPEISD